MLIFSDSSENINKSSPKSLVEVIHNSNLKESTSKRSKKKGLSKKNIDFLTSIGLKIKNE